jgi:hypothetical protein
MPIGAPGFYLQHAERIRSLSSTFSDPDDRRSMLDIAVAYEKMATTVAQWPAERGRG